MNTDVLSLLALYIADAHFGSSFEDMAAHELLGDMMFMVAKGIPKELTDRINFLAQLYEDSARQACAEQAEGESND
jgi:hypothetical protein